MLLGQVKVERRGIRVLLIAVVLILCLGNVIGTPPRSSEPIPPRLLEQQRKCQAVDMSFVDSTIVLPSRDEPGKVNLTLNITKHAEFLDSITFALGVNSNYRPNESTIVWKNGELDFTSQVTPSESNLVSINQEIQLVEVSHIEDCLVAEDCNLSERLSYARIHPWIRNYQIDDDEVAKKLNLDYVVTDCAGYPSFTIEDEQLERYPEYGEDGGGSSFRLDQIGGGYFLLLMLISALIFQYWKPLLVIIILIPIVLLIVIIYNRRNRKRRPEPAVPKPPQKKKPKGKRKK